MNSVLIIIFLFIAAVMILVAVLSKKGLPQAKPKRDYQYEKIPYLMTPAERSFFGVLDKAVDGKYRIFTKVRLADVIKVKSGLDKSSRQSAFNLIRSKHIDFVLCDPKTMSIVSAVELDDRSHSKPDRRARDDFFNKALSSAGIRLFRFPVKKGYTISEVKKGLLDQASTS